MNHIPRHADSTAAARRAPPHSTAFVQLHSGFCLDLMAPDLSGLTLTDLATGLSRIPRFTGATLGEHPYSVAQHSWLVATIMGERQHTRTLQAAGLLHDAHEALMGDITSPVKAALGGHVVQELEARLQAALARRFGLGPMIFAEWPIKHADLDALETERRDIMATPAWPWPEAQGHALSHIRVLPWPEGQAHALWLARAVALGLS